MAQTPPSANDTTILWVGLGVAGAGCVFLALCVAAALVFGVMPLRPAAPLRSSVSVATPFPSPPLATAPLAATPTLAQADTPLPLFTATPTIGPIATSATALPPAPPPAGRIVYTCFVDGHDDICTMNADGSDVQRLTTAPGTDFYGEWGPGGELITFSSRRDGEFHIYLMGAAGDNQQRISGDIGSLFAPDIAPDGRRIVFANARAGRQAIWVMEIDGSEARPLTDAAGSDIDPVWSPDGRQIAFASDRSGVLRHYVMDADGTNVRLLLDDVAQQGGRSDWSPDGRWLAFYAGPNDDRDIYMVATDGSGLTRRLTDGGRNLAPSFSPDGNWITFTSYRAGGNAEIFIMRPDGSDVRQLTFNEWADWQPRWSR